MKNANRARFAIAASAALALSAISSSASAQLDPVERQQECETLAWELCNPAPYPWNVAAFRCWHDTYDACMEGYLAMNGPDGDRRSEPAVVRA